MIRKSILVVIFTSVLVTLSGCLSGCTSNTNGSSGGFFGLFAPDTIEITDINRCIEGTSLQVSDGEDCIETSRIRYLETGIDYYYSFDFNFTPKQSEDDQVLILDGEVTNIESLIFSFRDSNSETGDNVRTERDENGDLNINFSRLITIPSRNNSTAEFNSLIYLRYEFDNPESIIQFNYIYDQGDLIVYNEDFEELGPTVETNFLVIKGTLPKPVIEYVEDEGLIRWQHVSNFADYYEVYINDFAVRDSNGNPIEFRVDDSVAVGSTQQYLITTSGRKRIKVIARSDSDFINDSPFSDVVVVD